MEPPLSRPRFGEAKGANRTFQEGAHCLVQFRTQSRAWRSVSLRKPRREKGLSERRNQAIHKSFDEVWKILSLFLCPAFPDIITCGTLSCPIGVQTSSYGPSFHLTT
jgi:hypothetical protein